MIPVRGQDQVVLLPTAGEIFFAVIDDMPRPDRPHHFHVARAAHARYFSPERPGDLHGKQADPAGGAVNQHLLPGLNAALIAQPLQGGHCRQRYCRCLLEGQVGRLQRDFIFTGAGILGKSAPAVAG